MRTETKYGFSKQYNWDTGGRLIGELRNGAPYRDYRWGVDDRLADVTLRDQTDNPVLHYTYDHQGTRVARSALPGASDEDPNAAATAYLTDYENPTGYSQSLAESVPGENALLRTNTFGPDGPLAAANASGAASYLHEDNLGTTRQLTDAAGSAIPDTYTTYEPFGTPNSAGLSSLTNYSYTGQYREVASGMQYHRARWLQPGVGRWVSEDPIFDFPNYGNGYLAFGGNPLAYMDTSGTALIDLIMGRAIHSDIEREFLAANPVVGRTEVRIVYRGRVNRIDMLSLNGSTGEVYEIKPFNERQHKQGRSQLARYRNALRGIRYGGTRLWYSGVTYSNPRAALVTLRLRGVVLPTPVIFLELGALHLDGVYFYKAYQPRIRLPNPMTAVRKLDALLKNYINAIRADPDMFMPSLDAQVVVTLLYATMLGAIAFVAAYAMVQILTLTCSALLENTFAPGF